MQLLFGKIYITWIERKYQITHRQSFNDEVEQWVLQSAAIKMYLSKCRGSKIVADRDAGFFCSGGLPYGHDI